MSGKEESENFVTVVAVGSDQEEKNTENINFESNSPGYVTVLTIGDTENNNKVLKDVTEEVIVYRLPGERLGFGLKFEGGTKANEFVKRLFIQSCAADSPASRVKSSWGKLTEGDEVLEIDSIPVNTMTRIDCVRCLKDSNVAIKLLVRHMYDSKTKTIKCDDDPPQVIGTEEKRTPPPPPPPPVPPRKIPRKLLKNGTQNAPPPPPPPPRDVQENVPQENNSVTQKQVVEPVANSIKSKKLQSPRGSIKSYYSPDVPRRNRRFSDGSLGPPDAEVYVDLFLQESTQSLSESDDTGSTISTVIDRFGSFPTTTTSSFSGSLPSTPTSVQRQLDISNITIYDDEDTTTNKSLVKSLVQNKEENNNIVVHTVEDGNPSCFQDAPLSYGNESTKILVPDEADGVVLEPEGNKQPVKKPPVPPRARDSIKNTEVAKETKNRIENTDLPRLVDFVPKSSNGLKENIENSTEIMKLFLENERYKTNLIDYETDENDNLDTYGNGIDIYSSKWSLSSQLATIGEVEEEGGSEIGFNRPSAKSTPVVIVENADCSNESEKIQCQNETLNNMNENDKESDGNMATLPSDSRQPPDGHEFPDFIENTESVKHSQPYFENNDKNRHNMNTFSEKDYAEKRQTTPDFPARPTNLILCHSVSSSNTDLRPNMYDSTEDLKFNGLISEPLTNLHTRSQSLIDMSALSKQKNTKWNLLMEQRRKGLSKLKGLVIPETTENEVLPAVSIPEIKSQNTTTFVPVQKLDNNINTQIFSSTYNCATKSSASIPPWPVNTTNNIPKYSPAFKRRSLQVYPSSINTNDYVSNHDIKYYDKPTSKLSKTTDDDLNPPKSLESISSPTRSDCSFDYVSSTKRYIRDTFSKSLISKEDESDNDSAVSSSQSSYNSRFSPPPSPTRSCDSNGYKNKSEDEDKLSIQNRLLKPSSVEAINRKNILASAKCRSGKDLKIGSPVIRRKQEDNLNSDETDQESVKKTSNEVVSKLSETKIVDKITDVEIISKKTEIKEAAKTISKVAEIENLQPPLPTTKPPSKYTFTPSKPPASPVSPKTYTKDSKENKFSSLYSSSSILSRQSKPINVKALKENFENISSTPPRLPVKLPVYKPQIATRNVKAEIAKTESKIISNVEIPVKKTEKVELKPKETKVLKPVEEKNVIQTVNTNKLNAKIIELRLDSLGGSLGITLAGGTDYENKEITVHRIRYGSVAYHDGRLKRGDKMISINGKSTNNLTHDEAVELLKEPVTEFIMEIEEGQDVVPSVTSNLQRRSSSLSVLNDLKSPIVEVPAKKANHVISFVKDGAGLGFSIEGGKDSPLGNVPLVVKKIFTGGAADKNGQLKVGDEILFINNINFTNLSRMEAWTLMKKVADGNVNIHIFR